MTPIGRLAGIRAVVFDAVGTLIVPSPGVPEVYAAAAARHDVTVDRAVIGERFRAAFRREERVDEANGWVVDEDREYERWRAIVRGTLPETNDRCFRELYDHFSVPSAWAIAPGVPALFEWLQVRGMILGVASNFDSRLDGVARGHPALSAVAELIVVSSRVGVRKPHPAFFAEVARRSGCRPNEILFVGDDRRNDYEGATAAGLRAVLLDPDGRHSDIPHRITAFGELAE